MDARANLRPRAKQPVPAKVQRTVATPNPLATPEPENIIVTPALIKQYASQCEGERSLDIKKSTTQGYQIQP